MEALKVRQLVLTVQDAAQCFAEIGQIGERVADIARAGRIDADRLGAPAPDQPGERAAAGGARTEEVPGPQDEALGAFSGRAL